MSPPFLHIRRFHLTNSSQPQNVNITLSTVLLNSMSLSVPAAWTWAYDLPDYGLAGGERRVLAQGETWSGLVQPGSPLSLADMPIAPKHVTPPLADPVKLSRRRSPHVTRLSSQASSERPPRKNSGPTGGHPRLLRRPGKAGWTSGGFSGIPSPSGPGELLEKGCPSSSFLPPS